MLTLRLKIDTDTITLDDMEAISSLGTGGTAWKETKAILQRFLVDENGQPLAEEEAGQLIGKLSITQYKEAVKQFRAAIATITQEALPNASGSS